MGEGGVRTDVGPAQVRLFGPAQGQIRVYGLLSPADVVHAAPLRQAVGGGDCGSLRGDHYHLDSVSVTFGAGFHSPRVRDALRQFVHDPDEPRADTTLRHALKASVAERSGRAPAHAPVACTYVKLHSGVAEVQLVGHAPWSIDSDYVIRQTNLCSVQLLAAGRALRRALAAAIRAGHDSPEAVEFLIRLLQAGGCADELELMLQAAHLPDADARLLSLFGCRAGGVGAGSAGDPRADPAARPARTPGRDVVGVLARLHADMAPSHPVAARAAGPAGSTPGSSAPGR